jgi:hypothetical protein
MARPGTPNTSVAGHAGELDVRPLQQRENPVARSRPGLDQGAAAAHQLAQVADRGRGDEAPADQSMADQPGGPLGVLHVGLAPGHVLDVVGVADDQLEVPLERGVDRLPADAGALHADVGDAVPGQPGPERLQLAHGRAEAAQQLLDLAPRRADEDTADDAGLVHVQAGAAFEEHSHRHHLSHEGEGWRPLRRRRGQTLPRVLARAGGDKG